MQGRMNATMRFVVWGTIPIGQVMGGVIATAVGLSAAIWVGAFGSLLAVGPLLLSPIRTLTTMPEPIHAGQAIAEPPGDGAPDLPPDAPSVLQR